MTKFSKGFSTVIIVIILLVIVGGAAYYFGTKRSNLSLLPANTPAETSGPTQPPPSPGLKSKVTTVDSVWNLYTNYFFGYSIQVPKLSFTNGGICSDGKLDVAQVPVVVFDNDKGAYITYEYFYEYPQNGACTKTQNTLAITDQRANQWKTIKAGDNQPFVPPNWHIISASVADDSQLDQFIKDNWGTGCKLGQKTLNSSGVYDVKIQGDGLDLEVTKCPLNFVVAVKYSSEFKKAATWAMGQAPVFAKDIHYSEVYDQDMAASFKFIK